MVKLNIQQAKSDSGTMSIDIKQHMMARRVPRLPPELLDRIIDYLHDDRADLRACSLACRSCVPAARFHLFHTTTLVGARDDFRRFVRLLTFSPTVGLCVRRLHVTFLPEFDRSLFSQIATYLGNVCSLTLVGVDIQVDTALLSQIGAVEHLALWASFRSNADVCALFYAFPRVLSLHVGSLAYPEYGLTHECIPKLPTVPLRRLRLDKGCTLLLQQMLTRPLPLLEDVEFSLHNVIHLEALHAFTQTNGHALKHLVVQIWYSGPESDQREGALLCESVAHCTALESAQFTCPAAVSWVAAALSGAPSSLKDITIDGFARDSAELDMLAAVLADPRFRDVRKVVIKLRQFSLVAGSVSHFDLSADVVRSRFAMLDARGILSVIA